MTEEKQIVFRHPQIDPDEYANPNFRPPEPEAVFSGTPAECAAYIERTNHNHDLDHPDLSGPSRPRLEIRRPRQRYGDTEPV